MKDPFKKFKAWFKLVKDQKIQDPTVFALATSDQKKQPHVRMVLLKYIHKDGFIFFTNLKSNKGKQFLKNNKLSMCFYWESIERQIRVSGNGEIVENNQSDSYFESRPLGSKIGAWASKQSSEISSRSQLTKNIKFYEKKFENQNVPRPNYWVGIKIKPYEFEFWKQGKFRLHQREYYFLKANKWQTRLLSP